MLDKVALPPAFTRALLNKPERFWLIVILLIASSATHLMWLSSPRQVVFDEVHFGKFITAYCCTHERFFDIHPPHAKLLIAGVAKLTGFQGGFSFSHIGQSYGEISPLALRLVSALAGTALPILFFVLLRQLGASQAAAFFGGWVVVFDNALTVQTRVLSLDGLLLLTILGSISVWLAALQSAGRRRWGLFAAAGALAGLAVGVKFTGLVALALLGVFIAYRLMLSRGVGQLKEWLAVGSLIMVSALVVYALGWALHFALLTEPGSGDAWRVPQWEKPVVISFVRETVELHKIMLDANYGLTAGHPDSSTWWEWPLMRTSVFYWTHDGADGRAGAIYLLGNPLLWWGSSVLLVVLLVEMGYSLACRRLGLKFGRKFSNFKFQFSNLIWIPLLGYFISYVPLIRVPRALFLYHYLTPLLFAWLVIILWLEARGVFKPGGVLCQPRYYFVVLGIILAFFTVFSPLTYGFLLSPELHDKLFWLSTWR